MRVKSTTNYYDRISRRTSIQAMLLLFTQGVMAAADHVSDTSGLAPDAIKKLARFPGVVSPMFFATTPVPGVTHFDDAVVAPPTNLLPQTASPASITDVGNPALYPGVGALATGWDFTLTASSGNVSAAFTGSGANTGTSTDYCVRLNRSLAGATLQTVAVKTNDHSLVQLLSVWLKLNLIPNVAASLCDITLQGYKANAVVAGATLSKTGLQTQVWTQFDVSANTNFIGVDEFRFTATPAASVAVSSMFVDEIALPTTPLPLTLLSFGGHREGADVFLSWNTASESNTDHFEIQRSGDGSNYSPVGRVAAAGNSDVERKYGYTDAGVASGTGWFYRLKMVDRDGKYTYSQVLSIGVGSAGYVLTAYPNPFRGPLNVAISSPDADKATLVLRDISGRVVFTKAVVLQKGNNTFSLAESVSLGKGTYMLSVSSSQGNRSVNVLKMD